MHKTNPNSPTAIVLAGQPIAGDLDKIFGIRETASLMIAGSMLIEHVLRELQDLNFSQCIVLANDNAHQIHSVVNGLQHCGMKIEVMNYALSKEQILREFKSLSQPNGLLVVETNQLRSQSIEKFLHACDKTDYSLYEAVGVSGSLGVTYLKSSDADFIINARKIEIRNVSTNPLQNTRDFHQANIDLIHGRFNGLESSVSSHRVESKLQHWSAQVHNQTNVARTGVMIDRKCCVERNVSLHAVVLNHNVYVERNAALKNTVVMPGAVIPSNSKIGNAVVHGEAVYQVSQ